jgi:hypothetical protein
MNHTEEYLKLDVIRKQLITDFSLNINANVDGDLVNLNNLTYLEMYDLGFNLLGKQEPEFSIPLWITPYFKSYIAYDDKVIEEYPLSLRYNCIQGMDYLIRPCDYNKFKLAYQFAKERRTTLVYEYLNRIRNAILNASVRRRLEVKCFNTYDGRDYLTTISHGYTGYGQTNIADLRCREALELGFREIDDNLFLIPNWINLYDEKRMFYGYVVPIDKSGVTLYLSQKLNKRLLEAQLNVESVEGFSSYVVELVKGHG